jgi:hypothetical protein
MSKAMYSIVERTDDLVVIRDVGHDSGFMTVTNDVENVVSELMRDGFLKVGQRLEYYDSYGERDAIEFDAKGFKRFVPMPRG